MLFENPVRADILVDHVAAHRDDPYVTDDIFLINDHVRRPRSDIHHGDSFLLFVGRQHGFGRSDRIQEKPERNDIHPFEGHLQPVDRDRIAQYDVERRRQFVAERPDRIGRLLLVVDNVVLRNDLQDFLPFGSRNVAHTVVQLADVLLADLPAAAGKYVIGLLYAADVLSRYTGIGFGDPDSLALSDRIDGLLDASGNQVDIFDFAADHPRPLHGGNFPVDNPNPAVLAFRADHRDHGIRP